MWGVAVSAAVSAMQYQIASAKEREEKIAAMTPEQRAEFFYQERTAAINRLARAKEAELAKREDQDKGSGVLPFVIGMALGSSIK